MFVLAKYSRNSKVLVIGGSTEVNEIIDFGDPNSNCNFPNFDSEKKYIHSTLQGEKHPLSCASWDDEYEGRDCYLYQENGTFSTYYNVLNENRKGSVSLYVPNIGWWFTGGYDYLSASEIVNVYSLISTPGPDLPKGLKHHCMVQINETHTFMIGGYNGSSYTTKTIVFDWEKREWIQQGNLNHARGFHSCGLHRNKDVIVAGGYDYATLDTIQVFDLDDPSAGWSQGPTLPREIDQASMVNLDGHLILVGGNPEDERLYECTGEEWVELEQQLQVGRYGHFTVFIPDDLLNC